MDINGISGNAASATKAALTPASPETASTPAAAKQEATPPKHDTVKLTGPALAKSMKLSGQTPAQIALKMGLDIKTVNGYLGIAAKTTTATLPPPTTTAPQVKQASTVPSNQTTKTTATTKG